MVAYTFNSSTKEAEAGGPVKPPEQSPSRTAASGDTQETAINSARQKEVPRGPNNESSAAHH